MVKISQDFLTTTQVAQKLSLSRVTIFNMIRDGRIPRAIRVGKNYLIPADFQKDFVREIAKEIMPILKKNHVKRAGVFGSIARGQRRKGSDLDILVDFKGRRNLLDIARLKVSIENHLKMDVDVLTYDGIHRLLKERILNHEVPIL